MAERKPFDPEMNDKRSLVRWIESQFPELDKYRVGRLNSYPEFEQRLPEIHQAVMVFLGRIQRQYALKDGTGMFEYYFEDIQRLPVDFEKKDTRKYAEHLGSLMFGIKEE